MGSFNESEMSVEYKSSLELSGFKYADFNKNIVKWSVEPYPIRYIKPTDNKSHRYYIDMLVQFKDGTKFLVEIKPKAQTLPPKKPVKVTQKTIKRYKNEIITYNINQAKWNAAIEFGKVNGTIFTILTEKELK
jgi:hypothetical protein